MDCIFRLLVHWVKPMASPGRRGGGKRKEWLGHSFPCFLPELSLCADQVSGPNATAPLRWPLHTTFSFKVQATSPALHNNIAMAPCWCKSPGCCTTYCRSPMPIDASVNRPFHTLQTSGVECLSAPAKPLANMPVQDNSSELLDYQFPGSQEPQSPKENRLLVPLGNGHRFMPLLIQNENIAKSFFL